jgi:alkanesulfonate monooxygenase SsuD/methylene tetrahydromethanopterin reductase-like flavin-dependent oxidoreductase (luciferase family)
MTAVGVVLDRSEIVRARDVADAARRVEELGFDGLFVGDHLAGALPMLDGTMLLAAAAAATERITLGFAVMVPVLRHAAWAAKQIATLQHLSGDRLVVGVGSGATLHGERAWEAVGVAYAERHARLESALGVLPDLIAGKEVVLAGHGTLALEPPATVPPFWVGGRTGRAVRCAACLGDGWFPSMVAPARVDRGARELRAIAARRGRPDPLVAVGASVRLHARRRSRLIENSQNGNGPPHEHASAGLITGDSRTAAERFAEYVEAGAEYLVLGILGDGWEAQCELLAEVHALLV